jgi:NitT/TauT family transport system ATP-binding protein
VLVGDAVTSHDHDGGSSGLAGTSPELLVVTDLSHRYQSETDPNAPVVMRNVSMTARPGEFISIVGPSGCGKSTLLSLVAGLEHPSEGSVRIKGELVTAPRRDIGFIFQRDALLPWRSLRDNVALALRYRKVPKKEAAERAQSWLARFGLGNFGDRFPYQVSGGQRKRASIAATMVYEPSIMLMDEPFAALDAQTRDLVEDDILRIWNDIGTQTVLFVTHDLEEAVAMSDRVVIFSQGPGTIIQDYPIDLPRPRDVREIRSSEEFRNYYEAIWEQLRVEVRAAQEAQGL